MTPNSVELHHPLLHSGEVVLLSGYRDRCRKKFHNVWVTPPIRERTYLVEGRYLFK